MQPRALRIFLFLSFTAVTSVVVQHGYAQTTDQTQPPLAAQEGPAAWGLHLGMTKEEFVAAYGGKKVAAAIGNDSTYGPHVEVGSLPDESGPFATVKGSIYFTPDEVKPSGLIFSIDREMSTNAKRQMDPDEAIGVYHTIVRGLADRFPVVASSMKDVPFPFPCGEGSTAAREYIDKLTAAVNQGADLTTILPANKRIVLAMNCHAIPGWGTMLQVNSRIRIYVTVDAEDGGGSYATVMESVFDVSASNQVRDAIRKARGTEIH
jgi:hypothetical protein